MVNDINHRGLIVTPSPCASQLVDELVALCDWPVIPQPSLRTLLEHIHTFRPACLLFWLEAEKHIRPTTELISHLRDRGPRPYRITVAHELDASAEGLFRAAGVHSYFATNGNLRTLLAEAIAPFLPPQPAATRRDAGHALDAPVPIRGPTPVRASPLPWRPP